MFSFSYHIVPFLLSFYYILIVADVNVQVIYEMILQILSKSEIFSISDVELGTRVEKNQKYAMTGSTWSAIRDYYPARIPKILQHGVVFARMSSDQKQQVIQELQAMGYYVGELSIISFLQC